MACNMASAHDIAVANSNGVTIYYNINSDGKTLTVTYDPYLHRLGDNRAYKSEISRPEPWYTLRIPKTVEYNNEKYIVTHIGDSALSRIEGSSDFRFQVELPSSLTHIGYEAFFGCSGLTRVNIPDSVTSIGDRAFFGCSRLTSVTIPNNVTSIGKHAFYGCSRLTSVTIPNSVTSIGSSAFSGCSGLYSVYIPKSVTSIGDRAFLGCSRLTSVTIPNSVTSIGYRAFYDCSRLTSITWNAKNYPAFSTCSNYSDNPFYDIRTQITEFITGNEVTSIPSYMCYGMRNLKSVTIGNSVTSIGSSAFKDCSGLEKVIVPDIKNWCSIKFSNSTDNPLYYTHHLYSDKNTEITELVIPNSVTSIDNYAFYGCSGLTSVTIPNSVTSIGSYAFYNCSGLKKVIVSDIKNWCSIKFGGNYANPLYYAHHLYSDENTEITKLVIPDSVTSIGTSAFNGCSGLTSVTIPNSVTSIGSGAFNGCSGLTSVKVMRKDPPTITSSIFSNVSLVYIPYGSKAKYEAAQYWKDFNIRMLSDSNGDDVVNEIDYSGVASYIMGDSPEEFDVEASDVDENGTVDVRDNVGIANIITTGSIYGGSSNNAKAAMSKGAAITAIDESDADNVIYVENVSGSKNSQVELSVRMRNASDIRGFQFDLYLPEGVSMANNAKASLSSDRLAAGDAHTLMADKMTDGAVRFLCSSMNDESFAGGDGEIATLTVNIADNVANGEYDVVVKNALMTETDISKSYEADDIKSTLTVLDQTGVETVTADDERRDGSIYTVGGQLVGKKATTSQLRKGVYIRNGKKIVVK